MTSEVEIEYLDLLGVPFFVELCMQDTFPDLHQELLESSDLTNVYETFVAPNVPIEIKACFLRLARRCFKINSRLRVKSLNIEKLLFRKYSDRLIGNMIPQYDGDGDDSQIIEKKYSKLQRTLFKVVFEVEKRCGMQGCNNKMW